MTQKLRNITAALLFMLTATINAAAQEFNATVEINSQSVEGTYKSVFDELQASLTEYLNNNTWTNAQFSPVERIECRFFLTVKEYKDDRVKGDLQVQLSRPVYNSTYTTTLLNFKDNKIEFDYREGDPLNFNETNWENNLLGIINFYAYLMLGMDFDSFSPQGGQSYYDKALMIVQQGQSSGEVGWKAFEDDKNRSALLSVFTDNNTAGYRDMLYKYHRTGLDEMVTSPDKGRASITESLQEIKKIYDVAPMSVSLTLFRDAKLDELVNVYSKSPQNEREGVYELLNPIYPSDQERLNKIKNPEQNR